MKRIFLIATTLSLLLSANSFAATEISRQEAMQQQRVSIGEISLNHNVVSPDDAVAQISKMADERGATAYHITQMHEPGSNTSIRVNAEIYR